MYAVWFKIAVLWSTSYFDVISGPFDHNPNQKLSLIFVLEQIGRYKLKYKICVTLGEMKYRVGLEPLRRQLHIRVSFWIQVNLPICPAYSPAWRLYKNYISALMWVFLVWPKRRCCWFLPVQVTQIAPLLSYLPFKIFYVIVNDFKGSLRASSVWIRSSLWLARFSNE